MDTSIIWSMIALALSGVGFLAYKHPPVAREIIRFAGSGVLLLMICHSSYINGYKDSTYAKIEPISFREWGTAINQSKIDIDSLEESYKAKPDTVIAIINKAKIEDEKLEQKFQLQNQVVNQIVQFVVADGNKQINEFNKISVFYQIALWGLAILFIVSYFFKDSGQPISNKKDDSAKGTTD